ncbi:hypothetical protein Tco_1465904 [Tanacetum coccineum]
MYVSKPALDADLIVMESNGTESGMHDTSSRSWNYITPVVDADIRPVNDQVLVAEVDSNTTPDATNMCHRGGEIDQDAEQYQAKSPLLKAEAQIQDKVLRSLEQHKSVDPKSNYLMKRILVGVAIRQRFFSQSLCCAMRTNTPDLVFGGKPTGRIFKIAGLRWIPTGKMFTDYTTKVDSEPPNGSNDDITNHN